MNNNPDITSEMFRRLPATKRIEMIREAED
jgi:hypothetical protein